MTQQEALQLLVNKALMQKQMLLAEIEAIDKAIAAFQAQEKTQEETQEN